MGRRRDKVLGLKEAVSKYVKDGMDVGIGGVITYNSPCAVVREIINQGIKDLTLYMFIGTYPADLLIGAGCVKRVVSPFITFAELGLAPRYRRMVEAGEVEVVEIDEVFWGFGLKAGAANLPFIPLAEGYDTDLPKVNPLYKRVVSPYDGKEYVTVPPIKPELSIIHVQYADRFGNGIHLGNAGTDAMLAKASGKVILTCDKLISEEEVIARARDVTIPGFLVEAVVPIEFCCHPLGSDCLYSRDWDHLSEYAKLARTDEGFEQYLSKYVRNKSHEEYLETIGRDRLEKLLIR